MTAQSYPTQEAAGHSLLSGDPKLAQILDEYLAALQTGTAPSQEDLLARYPDQAADLKECLASLEFIRQAAVEAVPPQQNGCSVAMGDLPAGVLGDFRILREIGRGGMGVVYEAVQISLDRRVALKVLPFAATLDSKHLQRFKNEAHAAAQLHHNNIVPVFAVGCERGVHYYAMQFVEGQTLATLIRELRQETGLEERGSRIEDRGSKQKASPFDAPPMSPHVGQEHTTEQNENREKQPTVKEHCSQKDTLPIKPRSSMLNPRSSYFRTVAQLGIQAAEALEYAHQMGIIHRDIKPGNLLLEYSAPTADYSPLTTHHSLRLWITDFGLAHSHSDLGLTMTGDLLGTLRYMSPEQALAKRELMDHRTDVYALGMTLYELLTLEPAFAGQDRQELLRQIAFDEPRPLRQVNPLLPAELETIVMKAMSKEPESRYGTAQELADDLRRFLDDQPIRAKRPTLVQRARKWARRHRAVVLAGLVLLVMALVASVISSILIWRAQQRTEAALGQALINQETAESHWARAEEEKETGRRYLYAAHMNVAMQAWETGRVSRTLELLQKHIPSADQEDLRGFEWYYLWRQCRCGLLLTLRENGKPVRAVHFLAGDRKLISGSEDGTIRLWDIASGQVSATMPAHRGGVFCLAVASDGETLVSGGADGKVKLWNLSTVQERTTLLAGRGTIYALALSPDHKLLAAGGDDDRGIVLLDLNSGQEMACLEGHTDRITSLAFSPDARTLASASYDHTIMLWDLTNNQRRQTIEGHRAYIQSLAFAPDGKTLASASEDRTIKLWDVATGQQQGELKRPGSVTAVAFLPDGKTLLSGSEEGAVRLWDVGCHAFAARLPSPTPRGPGLAHESMPPSLVRAQAGLIYAVAVSADGKLLASGGMDGTINLWDRQAFQNESNPAGHKKVVDWLAFSPDGRTLASGSTDQTIKLWEVGTGREWATLQGHKDRVRSLAFSPDGRILASGGVEGGIKLWDLSSGGERGASAPGIPRCLATVHAHGSAVWCVAFSPDGKTLASAGYKEKTVKLWDLTPPPPSPKGKGEEGRSAPDLIPRCLATLRGHTDSVWSVAFSPDGKTLASGGRDNAARLWDVATGQERLTLNGHRGWVWAVAFSPDGKTLATGSADGSVKLWDPGTGRERATLNGHAAFVRCLAFFPDGKTLVTGGDDGTAKLWDLVTLQEQASFKESSAGVWSVAVSPDGKTLATGSGSGAIKLWRAGEEPVAPARDSRQ